MTGGTTEQIRGRVEQTNEKGLKVDGRWFNWSQYSRSTVRPDEGDDVELEIARGKFINDARITGKGVPGAPFEPGLDDDPFAASAAPPPPPAAASTRTTSRSAASAPAASSSATPNADRNTEIRRLALIKAAADYAAARNLDPEEVVTLASQWEEWVVDRS
jgi:hypothetical protein